MFKKLLLAMVSLVVMMGFAFAQVDVNKADQAALDGVKGIGPSISKKIIDERKKGDFKDWADFQQRVKGVGEKNSIKLSQAGLVVNGQAKANAPATPSKATKAVKADKPAATDAPAAKVEKQNAKGEKAKAADNSANKAADKPAATPAATPAAASAMTKEEKKAAKAEKKKAKKAEKASASASASVSDKK